jgi:hypothetical protein
VNGADLFTGGRCRTKRQGDDAKPFLAGRGLCLTHSDSGRRDNFPNTAGEVAPGTAAMGKIACLDRPLGVPGPPLPVR